MSNAMNHPYNQKLNPIKSKNVTTNKKTFKQKTLVNSQNSNSYAKTEIKKLLPETPSKIYHPRPNSDFEAIQNDQKVNELYRSINENNGIENSGDNHVSSFSFNSNENGLSNDLEINRNYGTICPEINNGINENAGNFVQYMQTLTPIHIVFICSILLILLVMTIILYFTGNTTSLSYIWNQIFCWIGIIKCENDNK